MHLARLQCFIFTGALPYRQQWETSSHKSQLLAVCSNVQNRFNSISEKPCWCDSFLQILVKGSKLWTMWDIHGKVVLEAWGGGIFDATLYETEKHIGKSCLLLWSRITQLAGTRLSQDRFLFIYLFMPLLPNGSKMLGSPKCNFCPFVMIGNLLCDLGSSYLHKDLEQVKGQDFWQLTVNSENWMLMFPQRSHTIHLRKHKFVILKCVASVVSSQISVYHWGVQKCWHFFYTK